MPGSIARPGGVRSSPLSLFPSSRCWRWAAGLGRLVDAGEGTGSGSYLSFVAPALLAATAMMTAVGESTYPVVAGIKWTKSYHAALATPIAPPDLVTGLVGFLGVRVLFNLLVYAVIMVADERHGDRAGPRPLFSRLLSPALLLPPRSSPGRPSSMTTGLSRRSSGSE